MLSSFLIYRGGARHNAGDAVTLSDRVSAGIVGGDGNITAPAGGKKPNISALRALTFMLTGHIRRVEQGSAAGHVPRAERNGPAGVAAPRPLPLRSERSDDAPRLRRLTCLAR